jgi:hypothetical protein
MEDPVVTLNCLAFDQKQSQGEKAVRSRGPGLGLEDWTMRPLLLAV